LQADAVSELVHRYTAPPPPSAEVAEEPVRIVESVHAPSAGAKSERLEALASAHAARCPHCTTATAHTRLVFGEGNPEAEIVFVGEAPGETEDRLGRPFVGRAGEKLDEMIAAMGMRRDDVYIANVLKSRPPENRTPLRHEIEQCGPYLLAQIEVIRPKAIVTLGGPATKLLLASELGITRLRGIFGSLRLECHGEAARDGALEIPVMPTFHPAYLLRNYTPETRRQVWEDLKQVLVLLGREAPARR
jgi:DNA polymerase